MKKTIQFPEGFLWGSSTASEQIESKGNVVEEGYQKSNWNWMFEQEQEKFFEQRFAENDFWNRYEEDLTIAEEMNFSTIRLSISWSKLIKEDNTTNQKAVDKYREIFKTAKDKNMHLIVCLEHFEIPQVINEYGGFGNRKIIDDMRIFAKAAFTEFGDLVDRWAIFNEALANSAAPMLGIHPSLKENRTFANYLRSLWIIPVAQAAVIEEFKKILPEGKIGSIFVGSKILPRSEEKEDVEAAKLAEMMMFRCYVDPAIKGEFPMEMVEHFKSLDEWPEDVIHEEDFELFKNNRINWVGANYYKPTRIAAEEGEVENFDVTGATGAGSIFTHKRNYKLFTFWAKPGARMNKHRGMEISPETLYARLIDFKDNYGNIEVIITENGMGVSNEDRFRNEEGQIQDNYRIQFFKEHLYWVKKAIDEGANVTGFTMWTYIDNWSWVNAYKNRYGYIELDLETGKRIWKKSAFWAKELHKTNSFEIDEDSLGKELDD